MKRIYGPVTLITVLFMIAIIGVSSCSKSGKGRNVEIIDYWGSWDPVNPDGKAIYRLIDKFNNSQKSIRVRATLHIA